jgi:hypothetical protein
VSDSNLILQWFNGSLANPLQTGNNLEKSSLESFMNIETMRSYQYTSMDNHLKSIASLLQLFPVSDLTSYRDGGTGWTVTQVLCHLRDWEEVFHERAVLTVTKEMPDLPFPNPDEYAAERQYDKENPHDVFAAWKDNRMKFMAYLKERPESDWERGAMHPKRGLLTLHDQLLLTPQHDTIHLEQLTRVLVEKK